MKVEYINPFVVSIKSVFSTMLGCEITRGELFIEDGPHPHHDVTGIIGLSGKATGSVVLGLGQEVALAVTEAMLEERPAEINADVVDAVGELTNMIAGGAKARLEQLALSVSLPSVITGKTHSVQFPSRLTPICIPFDCPWGDVVLEVGLVEPPGSVPAAT